MLTKTLRQLERDGFVTRTLFPEVPPRVEYELTPDGYKIMEFVIPMWDWVVQNLATFKAARGRFDSK